MPTEERHSLECEYAQGKIHRFTSMWDKHCAVNAAGHRGMSLEEYILHEIIPVQEEIEEEAAQVEAAKQVLEHLSQIQEILGSDAARFLGQGDTRLIIKNITAAHDHFEDLAQYLEKH